MEGPSLKLTILKGPRRGKTLVSIPGSAVTIGRATGNTLILKNPGISMKHLSIEFSRGKWFIKDLDSSNGTFVNEILIASSIPSPLHDGDCLKFGGTTSILVNTIDVPHGGHGNDSSLRKYNGKRSAANIVRSISKDDRVAQNRAGGVLQSRDSKENRSSDVNGGLGLEKEHDDYEELKNEVVTIPKKPILRGRRRGVANMKAVPEEDAINFQKALEISEEKQGLPVTRRETRNSKNQRHQMEKAIGSYSFVEGMGKESQNSVPPLGGCFTRAGKGKTELKNSKAKSMEEVIIPNLIVEEGDKENCGLKFCKEFAGTSDIPTPDLCTMTLGDWFDYLEVALPQQIINETEAMIETMKKRAVQLAEYAAKNKAKGNP